MLMTSTNIVISRHRLPQPYRAALAALWLLPSLMLLATLALLHGGRALAVLLPLVVLALPALYIWREGVDVLPTGIVRRIHLPTRRYSYAGLAGCAYDDANGVLRVWDSGGEIALECRAGHLTEFERLRALLAEQLEA
jgi:hypothetical protein